MTGRRRCLFCGVQSKLTREHLWPEWLGKLRSNPGDPLEAVVTDHDIGNRRWPMTSLDMKVRMVCVTCNSGWMSVMEGAAKPLVTKMLTGATTELLVHDQLVLARWAVLKAIIFEARRADPVHTPGSRRQLRNTRLPPPTSRVRATAYGGHDTLAYLYGTSVVARWSDHSIVRVYCSTFVIGSLVLQVSGAPIPDDGTLQSLRVPDDVYIELFPSSGRSAIWPPPLTVDAEGLERFHRGGFPG